MPRRWTMDDWYEKAAVGIDLGTTYSAVGYIARTGRPELITNFFTGDPTTPSVVLFEDATSPIQVGENAKSHAKTSGDRVVECAKRRMHSPRSRPWNGPLRQYSPEDISTIILRHLKRGAELRLGKEVGCAVITVPAWFDDDARQATSRAGIRAGLEVIGILSEPTAAAIAWAIHSLLQGGPEATAGRTILVYDLGGGTFDVSIVRVEDDGTLTELKRNGDVKLGGKDWDHWLSMRLFNAFKEEHKFPFPKEHEEYCNIEILEAEKAKKWLSNANYRDMDATYDSETRTKIRVQQQEFLQGTKGLLDRTMGIVHDTLGDARLLPSQVDLCLPVGGSTRMPQVRQALNDLFGADRVDDSVQQQEVVALGATLFMARKLLIACEGNIPNQDETNLGLLDPRVRRMLEQLQVVEVSPRSYGISGRRPDSNGGVTEIDHFIRKNESLPRKYEAVYYTQKDRQKNVNFGIYEGDSKKPADCVPLGDRRIALSRPTPRNTRLEFEIHITSESMITVRMRDPHTKKWKQLTHVLDDKPTGIASDRRLLARVDSAFPE